MAEFFGGGIKLVNKGHFLGLIFKNSSFDFSKSIEN